MGANPSTSPPDVLVLALDLALVEQSAGLENPHVLIQPVVIVGRRKASLSWRALGVVGPGLASAADARHRSLRDHGALGSRALTRPADRPLVPVPTR